jgi:methionyl-tRNA formyltransferase
MKITIITDNARSWFIPYGLELQKQLQARGHQVSYVHAHKNIPEGDICFVLSCVKLLKAQYLLRNKSNIIVHASDLPAGRGWSPLQWQVLENKDTIPLTLIEAASGADEGPYYLKSKIKLDGSELLPRLRQKMAQEIIKMCLRYVAKRKELKAIKQTGKPSSFRRRESKDDEINIDQSIRKIFNQLRIADNDRHPVYFRHLGKKYFIKIYDHNDLPGHK